MKIEFNTKIDKPYIQVPEYEKLQNKNVKVVIISNNSPIEYLANNPKHIKEDFLSREEANDR